MDEDIKEYLIKDRKEQREAEAIKVDDDLYQTLTDETVLAYLPVMFGIGELEGDFIAQFDQKVRETGITVKEEYVRTLWETQKEVPGVDLRSGEYGMEYAGAGFLRAGCQFYAKKDIKNAMANFAKAIELCPQNILARSLKAQIHAIQGKFWFAAVEAGNSLLLNPLNIIEKDSASRAVFEQFPPVCETLFEELLVHSHQIRGSAFYNLAKFDEAIEDINEVIKRKPNLLASLDLRLMSYLYTNRWEEAIADCDTLLAGEYEKARICQYRAYALRELKRYEEAIDYFTRALDLDPGADDVLLQRSDCFYKAGLFEDAYKDAHKAVKRKIEDARYFRAMAYHMMGEFTKAIADFDFGLREHPNSKVFTEMREKSVAFLNGGITMRYRRRNKKGEEIQIERREGKIKKLPGEKKKE